MPLTAFLSCPQNVLWASEAHAGLANLAGALRGGGGWTPKPGRCPDFNFQQFLLSDIWRLVIPVVSHQLSNSTSEAPGQRSRHQRSSRELFTRFTLSRAKKPTGEAAPSFQIHGLKNEPEWFPHGGGGGAGRGVSAEEEESRVRNGAVEAWKRAVCRPIC